MYCCFISIFIDNKIKIFVCKYFVVFSMNTTTCIKYHVHFHFHYNFRIQLAHYFDPRVGPPPPLQNPGSAPAGTLSFFLIALCLAVAVYIIALCFIAIVLYCFMSMLFDVIDLCLSLPFYCIDFYVAQWHFWYFIASCLLLC